ncbi:MAG TPA: hypothetical protein VFW52_00875 [Candidatus Saccharimonadales bacterium]|nr:hypothetical protein [Candidatus Saccharimonadales bacterium]
MKPPERKDTAAPNVQAPKSKGMNLDLKTIVPKLKKSWQKFSVHLPFALTLLVLLVYLLVVWQIKNLSAAEPSPEAESQAINSAKISRIDKQAIGQIQNLEENSPQIKALFDKARQNPFSE